MEKLLIHSNVVTRLSWIKRIAVQNFVCKKSRVYTYIWALPAKGRWGVQPVQLQPEAHGPPVLGDNQTIHVKQMIINSFKQKMAWDVMKTHFSTGVAKATAEMSRTMETTFMFLLEWIKNSLFNITFKKGRSNKLLVWLSSTLVILLEIRTFFLFGRYKYKQFPFYSLSSPFRRQSTNEGKGAKSLFYVAFWYLRAKFSFLFVWLCF